MSPKTDWIYQLFIKEVIKKQTKSPEPKKGTGEEVLKKQDK